MLSNEELLNEWTIYGIGHTIGKKGPEYGEILFDEQSQGKARITLERCKNFFAVTCGIYGLMLHTAYCEEIEAMEKYREMKLDISRFLYLEHSDEELETFCEEFCNKY